MNNIIISGQISPIEFSHESHMEKMYKGTIKSLRASMQVDELPFVVNEKMLSLHPELNEQQRLLLSGEIRTYNKVIDGKNRLLIYIFVTDVSFCTTVVDVDRVDLDGFICKKPNYRLTPLGRELTEILIASNRPTKKSDYIPCICWGHTAQYASSLSVGDPLYIIGRLQSREYDKDGETKVAYELSISHLHIYDPFEDIDHDDI